MITNKPTSTISFPTKRVAVYGTVAFLGLLSFLFVNWRFGLGIILIALILSIFSIPIRLNPLTVKKIVRFKHIRRGYYSFLVLLFLSVFSLFAELVANNRALVVRYGGDTYFPTYSDVKLGKTFGLEGPLANAPVNYRDLQAKFKAEGGNNWVLMPVVPYGPNENNQFEGVLKPRPPNAEAKHYLGTDGTGRDITSRLIYGFRIAVFFSLAFMSLVYLIGITIGSLMGYFGGWFDLFVQRLIEIWSLVPFIYMVIIIFSVIPTSFSISTRVSILLGIMVLFSWTGMTYYMRTATYREKARDYTAAAQIIGAGPARIIFNHILPNTISTIVTFMPFTMAAAITAITALDFLGFGLPPPTPSIGEILKQGTARLDAPWIVTSAFVALVFILTLVTFIGEAVREAFDPKKFTTYR
ncbi:MAG: ABC transporter permease subunit [Puniceicoccaceae bacterium]